MIDGAAHAEGRRPKPITLADICVGSASVG